MRILQAKMDFDGLREAQGLGRAVAHKGPKRCKARRKIPLRGTGTLGCYIATRRA